MKRYLAPIFFMTLIFMPVYFYLGYRLGNSPVTWFLLAVLLFLIASFPFNKLSRPLVQTAFIGMGLLTYLLVFTVLRDFYGLYSGVYYDPALVLSLAVLAVALGSLNARTGPRIRKIKISIPGLAPELAGLRIAQISDLHVGATIGAAYVDRVIERTNGQSPDLIALTGDIADGAVAEHRDVMLRLSGLSSKYGIFYVPGNHAYYWNVNDWLKVFAELKFTVLLNQGTQLLINDRPVHIGGVVDPAGKPGPDAKLAAQNGETSTLRILLSHRPGIAEEAAAAGFNLQLSGHTHGGQFFPWTLVVRLVHRYSSGLHRHKGLSIYVNRGTGSWGPLIRLGTTPEITVFELFRSEKS